MSGRTTIGVILPMTIVLAMRNAHSAARLTMCASKKTKIVKAHVAVGIGITKIVWQAVVIDGQ